MSKAGCMADVIAFLRSKEWTAGNGQCPECYGAHAGWYGHPCFLSPERIGHKPNCGLALALRDLGESPIFMGQFAPTPEECDARYERKRMLREWANQ